jgi:hypothetical protein
MRSMLEHGLKRGNWTRIERRDHSGRLLDFVEVGQCAVCGHGVDRDFPVEYRELDARLLCAACAAPTQLILSGRLPLGLGRRRVAARSVATRRQLCLPQVLLFAYQRRRRAGAGDAPVAVAGGPPLGQFRPSSAHLQAQHVSQR